jgi:hypothetical protein
MSRSLINGGLRPLGPQMLSPDAAQSGGFYVIKNHRSSCPVLANDLSDEHSSSALHGESQWTTGAEDVVLSESPSASLEWGR